MQIKLNQIDEFLANTLIEFYDLESQKIEIIFLSPITWAIARLICISHLNKKSSKAMYRYEGLDSSYRFKEAFEKFLIHKIKKDNLSYVDEIEEKTPSHKSKEEWVAYCHQAILDNTLKINQNKLQSLTQVFLTEPKPAIKSLHQFISNFEKRAENTTLMVEIRNMEAKLQRNRYTQEQLKYSDERLNDATMILETKSLPEDEKKALLHEALILETRLDVYEEEAPLVILQVQNRTQALERLDYECLLRFKKFLIEHLYDKNKSLETNDVLAAKYCLMVLLQNPLSIRSLYELQTKLENA